MLRRLSLALLASAISIASLPAIAQEDGSAEELGVMSISLADVVNPPLAFKVHCRVQEHQTKLVLAGSFHCLLVRTVSGFLMSSLMPTLLTEQARAASSTPMLLEQQSAPPQGLVIAG